MTTKRIKLSSPTSRLKHWLPTRELVVSRMAILVISSNLCSSQIMCNDFNRQNLQYSCQVSETKASSAGLKSLPKQSTVAMALQKHFLKYQEFQSGQFACDYIRFTMEFSTLILCLSKCTTSWAWQGCVVNSYPHYEPLICWVWVVSQKGEMQFSICFLSWPFITWLYYLC